MIEKISKITATMVELGYRQFAFSTLTKSIAMRTRNGGRSFDNKEVITYGFLYTMGISRSFTVDKDLIDLLDNEAEKSGLVFSFKVQIRDEKNDREITPRVIFKFSRITAEEEAKIDNFYLAQGDDEIEEVFGNFEEYQGTKYKPYQRAPGRTEKYAEENYTKREE